MTASSSSTRYTLLSSLGRVGMGEVFLADDTQLGRKVAIRFLSEALEANEKARERLRREARAAAALASEAWPALSGWGAGGRLLLIAYSGDGDVGAAWADERSVLPEEPPHMIMQPEPRRWYARMLLDRNGAGDKDKARTLLDEAIEMYGTLGMPRHLDMAKGMLGAL